MLAVLLFLPHINNPWTFIIVAIVATLLPDIDTGFSSVGSNIFAKFITFFSKHRGMFHSLTFSIVCTALLVIFLPSLSLAFFLGYALHIFADSFTKEGVMPFWPWRQTSSWHFNTGGMTETAIFIGIVIADIVVAIFVFRTYF